mgnify:CR=1 FL=1
MLEANFHRQITGIRFGIKAGGCSGFEYILRPIGINEERPADIVMTASGVRILINPKSAPLISGTEIDWNLMGFTFKNPNAKSSCGCGVSFEPK